MLFCHPAPSLLRGIAELIKITAGLLKGKTLTVPVSLPIRPTTALVREAIFNRLGVAVLDARFLDLFAGSGLMSFEAYSRGAKDLVAVDQAKSHCARMIQTAHNWQIPIKITCQKVERFLAKTDTAKVFDVVFIDPPYTFEQWDTLWPLLLPWLHATSQVIAEHEQPSIHPQADCRSYGNTKISWLTGAQLL